MQILDSLVDGGQALPERERERLYRAYIEYLRYGVEPEGLEGAALAVWVSVLPSLRNSRARAEAGRAGGSRSPREGGGGAGAQAGGQAETQADAQAETQADVQANAKQTTKQTTQIATSEEEEEEEEEEEMKGKGQDMAAGGRDSPPGLVEEAVSYLNERAGTRFRASSASTARHVRARAREGYSLDDIRAVVDAKVAEWGHDQRMAAYIRPETLFGPKFEGYLQAARARGARAGAYEQYR